MRYVFAIAILLVAGCGGCDKAPAEPSPAARGAGPTPAASAAQTPAGRCLKPTPEQKPAPVAPGPDPSCPPDPEGGPPMVPVGHVAFPESKGAPRLEVELMLTEDHQQRGLMYRKTLADDHGMLFAWDGPSVHSFWMHNTCLPLDMLFIDETGFIAGIVENAPTLNDMSRSIKCPVNYVLEVNAGWARKYDVRAGQRVKIDGIPR
jgi:uncharacterized protein